MPSSQGIGSASNRENRDIVTATEELGLGLAPFVKKALKSPRNLPQTAEMKRNAMAPGMCDGGWERDLTFGGI